MSQLGALVGLFVAALVFAGLVTSLSGEKVLDWGWRYPLFVVFAINVVALFARLRIGTTPEYQRLFQSRELQPATVPATVRAEGPKILAGAFVPLARFALFPMVTVFPLCWVFLYTSQSPVNFLLIESLGAVFGFAAIVVSGWASDKIGRSARMLALASDLAWLFGAGFAPLAVGAAGTSNVCGNT